MMRPPLRFNIIIFIFAISLYYAAYAFDLPKWFPFNRKDSLNEWEEKIFNNKVFYEINTQGQISRLNAKSDKACSGLIYKIVFYPKKMPMISWLWQVNKFPAKKNTSSAGGWIEKDDYAARVYIIFPSWYFMHTETLEYVWDETEKPGTIKTSPYFDKIKIIVAQSGSIKGWVPQERNIYEDFKRAFGKEPGRVGAIAIMTDTDNTQSTAEASYRDLKVGYTK